MADRRGPMSSHTYENMGADISCYAVEQTPSGMLVRLMFKDHNLEHKIIPCKMVTFASDVKVHGMYPSGRYPGAMLIALEGFAVATLIDGYKLRLSQTRDA